MACARCGKSVTQNPKPASNQARPGINMPFGKPKTPQPVQRTPLVKPKGR